MRLFLKHIKRRWKKKFQWRIISKRQVFVVVTIFLTALLVLTQFTQDQVQYELLIFIGIVTYILSIIALREDLHSIEFITLFILPVLFTISVSLFYFLLPQRLLTRLPIVILYAIGIYAVLLTENIYNVAAERTIALLRAAQSVGFLVSLVTAFFLIEAIVSLHQDGLFTMLLVFVVVFLLSLQSLWSMTLEQRFTSQLLVGSFTTAFIIAQVSFVFSFWPVQTTINALFLTTLFYTLVGMSQQYLVERLFKRMKNEFLAVLVLIFALVLFVTKWGFGKFV